MATDRDTFNVLLNILNAYVDEGGSGSVAYLDGSYDTGFDDWLCVNTQGSCPATMPWDYGPSNTQQRRCVAVDWDYGYGVVNTKCFIRFLAICQFTMSEIHSF